jgi:crotonobetainyl-CoA:carnitine CoA-transferase CaiB-like acyl-CoA transferase
MTSKPLRGVKVLDLTRLLPGPLCTKLLREAGATVIKIEDPVIGDYAKYKTPPYEHQVEAFKILNRGKKGLILDFTKESDRKKFLALCKTADVVVEGFRPGVLKKLGLDYARVKKVNPKIVYCSITGYGQKGPMRDVPGHDLNYLALSGILDQIGRKNGPPVLTNFQIADISGALMACNAILAALFGVARKRGGSYLDISLMKATESLAILPEAYLRYHGKPAPRGGDFLSGAYPCYNIYETSDGRHLAVGAMEKKFWENFCATVGRKDLVPQAWNEASVLEVQKLVLKKTLRDWVELFAKVEACVSPVLTTEEAKFGLLKE